MAQPTTKNQKKNSEKEEPKEQAHSMENAANSGLPAKQHIETPDEQIARLEQENQDLKKIAASQPTIAPADARYMKDMAFFDKQKVGANKIQIKEITDHKNISLWTAWGKRIGPMHPDNARACYHKFRKLNRILFVEKPTEEQIQAYYKTDEYKAWKKKFDADRARKEKSRRGKEFVRIMEAMAQLTGMKQEDLVKIYDKPTGVGAER